MKDLPKENELSSNTRHTNSNQKNKYRVQSLTLAEFCVLPAFKTSSEDIQRGRYKSSHIRSSHAQNYNKSSNERSSVHLNSRKKSRFHHSKEEPWIKSYKGTSLSLHDEILLFSQYISPYPEEIAARQELIERIQAHVVNLWPNAQVVTFGSFTNQTFLPTSDVDIVIQNMPVTNDISSTIYSLADSFKSEQVRIHHVLIKAKVPLIKLQDIKSGFSVDLSYNISNGPENTQMLKKYLDKYKSAVPLLHLLKYFLFSRGLNEPFRGGVGSYALMIMLISFFQMRYKKKDNSGVEVPESETHLEDEDLGALLQDFLYQYSTEFDNRNKGISIRNGGSYFSKKERGWFNYSTPELFSLEDPHDLGNDVGRTAFASTVVKQEFKKAYDELVKCTSKEERSENEKPVSRLSQLGISIDYFISHQREFIKRHTGSVYNGRPTYYTPNAAAYQSIAVREEKLREIAQRISLCSAQN